MMFEASRGVCAYARGVASAECGIAQRLERVQSSSPKTTIQLDCISCPELSPHPDLLSPPCKAHFDLALPTPQSTCRPLCRVLLHWQSTQ